MFDIFGFRRNSDLSRADDIIEYLNEVFGIRSGFFTNQSHHTQLQAYMSVIDVKITCSDDKISIALQGYSDSNFEEHVPGQVQHIKEAIRRYLEASHAAKWRSRVIVRG